MEVWKDIKGYENYKVSNFGNVIGKKIKTNFGVGYKIYDERKINPWLDKKGYNYIDISIYPNKKRFLLHRLVAKHFLDNPNNYPQVNHKDGNKSNNHVDNLEWCTSKQNINHAIKTGLLKFSGCDNYRSELSKNDVLEIRKSKLTQRELSEKYKISQTGVSRIKSYKTYKNV